MPLNFSLHLPLISLLLTGSWYFFMESFGGSHDVIGTWTYIYVCCCMFGFMNLLHHDATCVQLTTVTLDLILNCMFEFPCIIRLYYVKDRQDATLLVCLLVTARLLYRVPKTVLAATGACHAVIIKLRINKCCVSYTR
jgi:hypothetical protein